MRPSLVLAGLVLAGAACAGAARANAIYDFTGTLARVPDAFGGGTAPLSMRLDVTDAAVARGGLSFTYGEDGTGFVSASGDWGDVVSYAVDGLDLTPGHLGRDSFERAAITFNADGSLAGSLFVNTESDITLDQFAGTRARWTGLLSTDGYNFGENCVMPPYCKVAGRWTRVPVPEPLSLGLFGAGFAALMLARRRARA